MFKIRRTYVTETNKSFNMARVFVLCRIEAKIYFVQNAALVLLTYFSVEEIYSNINAFWRATEDVHGF